MTSAQLLAACSMCALVVVYLRRPSEPLLLWHHGARFRLCAALISGAQHYLRIYLLLSLQHAHSCAAAPVGPPPLRALPLECALLDCRQSILPC